MPTPGPEAPSARPSDPSLPGLLVEPWWLKERLGSPRLRVVDLRDREAYTSGHVPGAAHLELAELGSSSGGLENVLLGPEDFSAKMAESGISNGDLVVAYDDQWGLAAARLVWALNRYGHDGIAVLDGGWDRWEAEDGPRAEGHEDIARGSFRPASRADAGADVHADRDWIEQRLGAAGLVLIDTRSKAEFDAGHLPGALHWEWFDAVPAGSWNVSRDAGDLRAEWETLGFRASDEVIVYCRSGMRAAHTYLVMRNAGYSRVRLYDGSWQEWSMKRGREVGD